MSNSWNEFQKQYAGSGLRRSDLSSLYRQQQQGGNPQWKAKADAKHRQLVAQYAGGGQNNKELLIDYLNNSNYSQEFLDITKEWINGPKGPNEQQAGKLLILLQNGTPWRNAIMRI